MKLKTTLKAYLLAAACISAGASYSQKQPAKRFGRTAEFTKCGTTEYEARLQKKNPARPTTAKFEQWLAPKVAARKAELQRSGMNTNTVVTIPVVVHVIHNGVPVGTGENIADGQILSQITTLNQDFRKMLGTPGYNTNPVGADMEIEFCMAQRDPNGINSNGIVRYAIVDEDGWDMDEIEVLKAQTQWDPGKYLNIWLFKEIFTGFGQLAGYAQFPTESGLDGLDETGLPTTANTDGVALASDCFGSEDIYPDGNYFPGKNMGRTASHEIGHFFGLRHIWGDESNCSGNDFCNDTPVASDANGGCPEAGFDSCPDNPGDDMVQNYMDYTDDSCLNIFTQNQKDRMQAVLANSPRRASLTTSNGCIPGVVYDNDGSLNIQGFNTEICGTGVTPQLVLTNTGNNVITTATISNSIDGQAGIPFVWTGNLANGQQATIELPNSVVAAGEHLFAVSITSVNGVADQAAGNDTKSQSFTIVGAYNTTEVVITIMTDDYGDETLWALMDSNEEPIATNVDPDDFWNSEFYGNNELHTFTVDVLNNECYTFGIFDLAADGICCDYGEGYYTIETADGQLIAGGGQFGETEEKSFRVDTSLGLDNVAAGVMSISLYPNPSRSTINIAIPGSISLPDTYTIYNNIGQVIGRGAVNAHTSAIDISAFSNGMYFIKLAGSEYSKTMQFIKK